MEDHKKISIVRDIEAFEPATVSLQKQGCSYTNRILESNIIESNHYLSQQLQIPRKTELFYLCRLRVIEGVPMSIEKSYIPYEKVKGIEKLTLEDNSYYGLLEETFGLAIYETKEELLLVEAKQEEMKYLHLEQGDEILFEKGVSFLSNGTEQPFEYFEMASLPSLYQFRSVSQR